MARDTGSRLLSLDSFRIVQILIFFIVGSVLVGFRHQTVESEIDPGFSSDDAPRK